MAVSLFNVGVCLEQLGDRQAALETFRRYLADYETSASPEDVAEVRSRMESLERALETEAAGTPQAPPSPAMLRSATWSALRLDSSVPGALVAVDGLRVGHAPLEQELPPGPHQFSVSADGYQPQDGVVEIVAGEVAERFVDLAPATTGAPAEVPTPRPSAVISPPANPRTAGTDGGLGWWFWTSVGLGSAAAVSAAVTGSLTLHLRSDYLDGGRADRDLYETGMDLGIATDVLVGVAAAAALVALIAGLVDLTEDQPDLGGPESSSGVPGGIGLLW
jgi:hypothetical protein